MENNNIIQIQFASWDKKYNVKTANPDLEVGSKIIVDTENGEDMATVISKKETPLKEGDQTIKSVVRTATEDDMKKIATPQEKKKFFKICKDLITKHNLPMKLVDVNFSLDKKKVNFAFMAEGRVDFRNLVKELTSSCRTSIRLTQIGIRDEAKFSGDCGPCGKILCCKKFLKEFHSITSEMAETQQVVHRGSERISGMCNRLMCCLAYEQEGYEEMSKKMPKVGEKIKLQGYKGEVVGVNLLKQTVQLKLDESSKNNNENGAAIIEVSVSK